MKNRKQLISCVFFCAILLLPILAIGILQFGQAYLKSTREERLHTEKTEQVVIPEKQIVWEEEGKELWVGQRMFDVNSFVIKDGNCYLTGVYDDDETEIAGSLLHILFSETDEDLLYLLFLLECFSACAFFIVGVLQVARKKQWVFYLFTLPFPCYLVLGPPPRD